VTADSWRAVIDTAEAHADATAYEIDQEDTSTDVDVAVGDRSVEVTVSADGTEVVGTEEDELDADDRQALAEATVTLADAIATAVVQVPGTLDDAALDEDGGTVVWEVTVIETGDDVEVFVDVSPARSCASNADLVVSRRAGA
jgi:uncharacterized membrane protein YkoI